MKNKNKNRKLKILKVIAPMISVVIFASGFIAVQQSKASTVNATLLLNPSSASTTTTGSNVTYTARVNPGSNTVNGINAVQLDMTFNTSVVHLVSVNAVAPFSIMTPQDITAANGSGTISVVLFIGASSVTTTSDVATLVFSPQGSGTNSPISFAGTAEATEYTTGDPVVSTRTGATVTVTVADTTPPSITATAPATNAFIKSITTSSAVSYTLSEAIASGSIVFTRTGGSADGTVHTCTLKGTALNTGAHNNLDLSNTTNSCTSAQTLVSGAVYSVVFNATDAAGNAATPITNTSITFDNTVPSITATAPATNAFIKSITTSSAVSYTLSEAIASGSIVFTRTGGSADGTVHTCTLKGTALNTGAHNNLDLSNTTNSCTSAQTLVSGAVYSVVFNATDAAGNNSIAVSNTGITFDSTPPVASQVTPPPVVASNNTASLIFSSNEIGTISFSGGCTSATTSATSGNNTIVFNALARGATYSCTVTITDAAGNATPIVITPFAVTYRGDLDNSKSVTIADLSTFATDYGRTNWAGHVTDINGDSNVNVSDLSILASDYGKSF